MKTKEQNNGGEEETGKVSRREGNHRGGDEGKTGGRRMCQTFVTVTVARDDSCLVAVAVNLII